MKKVSVLWSIVCLFLATGVVSAQNNKATDFSGNWEINIAGSKLPERMRVGATSMIVIQTDNELTVETIAKRVATPETPTPTGGERAGANGRNGEYINFPGLLTFNLTGDTVEVQSDAPVGTPSSVLSLNANFETDGRLKLNQSNRVTAPDGEYTTKINDTWELSPDGKTLKVKREMTTTRGVRTAEMYFVKNNLSGATNGDASPFGISNSRVGSATLAEANGGAAKANVRVERDKSLGGFVVPQKHISGGVLNAKALQMPKPAYPGAARAVKAKGAVNVEVTVNESGSVVAATAVSGHPLLRAAAVEAARGVRFAPTVVKGIPVKVDGILVYNFVP